ncbi:Hypothetical protein POVR2_LOCUS55 [uncultured virus]|nr:Hypothetical protein POVR2_LOCUS55 [uncultured virus]
MDYPNEHPTLLHIDSIEDLLPLVLSLGADRVLHNVGRIPTVGAMIEVGLWPQCQPLDQPWIADWLLTDLNDQAIEFWHRCGDVSQRLARLRDCKSWSYNSIKTYKDMGERAGLALPLLLYAPSFVYKTMRPKTDMSLFRTPQSITIRRSYIKDMQVVLSGETWHVLPVTRYAMGMKKGLYYNETRPDDVKGTFYYYEPESTTYLGYKKKLTAFNKTTACIALGIPNTENYDLTEILKHSDGVYPRDLMLTAKQANEIVPSPIYSDDLDPRPHYAGSYLYLYGAEDAWDQPLAIEASKQGYDIVVLESMVGRYQVVTEVLDTRDQATSFSMLLYLED